MAVAAFRRADVGLVSVMLGTNDSRDDRRVPAAVYRVRLGAIEVALREAGFRVVVQTPPVTANARFDAPLLASYLGAGMRVSMVDGVHPDAAGVRALGAAWAVSVGRALER